MPRKLVLALALLAAALAGGVAGLAAGVYLHRLQAVYPSDIDWCPDEGVFRFRPITDRLR